MPERRAVEFGFVVTLTESRVIHASNHSEIELVLESGQEVNLQRSGGASDRIVGDGTPIRLSGDVIIAPRGNPLEPVTIKYRII